MSDLDADVIDALRARLALGAPSDRFGTLDLLRRAVRAGRSAAERRLLLAAFRDVLALSEPPASVVVWAAKGETDRVRDLARERFRAPAAITRAATSHDALSATESGDRAVLALDPTDPWWAHLLARPELRVTGMLPELLVDGPPEALVVERWRPEPSGDDRTFYVADAPARVVESALQAAGLAADLMLEAGGLKLFELYGYVQAHDDRLRSVSGPLSGVIGAAPAPFDA